MRADLVSLIAVQHTELVTEIVSQADEQNTERYGDQVQRTDRERGKPGVQGQPGANRHEDCQDQFDRAHGHIENQADHYQRQDGRPDRALLQRRKLLVIQRDRSGQAHPQPVLRVDLQLARQAPYFGAGAAAGLERVEIEHRPRQDEAAQVAPVGREPGHQALPRDGFATAVQNRLHRVGYDR